MKCSLHRFVVATLISSFAAMVVPGLSAQEQAAQSRPQTTEPVYRVSKNVPAQNSVPHSLDPAIRLAYDCMGIIENNVNDYTAKLVKRERIGEELGDYEYMFAKFRNRKLQNGQIVVPFSVYLGFLKPSTIKGREVLYVEGQNQGRMLAHEGGMKRMLGTHVLEPTGWLAMQGQRYPITDIGIANLTSKLIERAERDKQVGECSVKFFEGAKVSQRDCTVVQVEHPEQKAPYDFHIAQVFIDNEYRLPVRYAAYAWPKVPGGEPELIEEYTYQEISFNVGLTDKDFDVNNPEYAFHKK